MKVLLVKDVSGIGNKGQIKDVKQGYALNFLIPNKLAVSADDVTVSEFNKKQEAKKAKVEEEQVKIKNLLSELNGKSFEIKVKANEKGHLFKAIKSADIVELINEGSSVKIDESFLEKNIHLKEIGDHLIVVSKVGERAEIKLRLLNS